MRIVLRGKVPLATDVAQEMAKWEARSLDVISALYVQPSLKGTFWEEYEVWGGNKQSKGKTSQCCLLQRRLGWRTRHVSREYLNYYDTVGFINLLLHLNQIFTRGRLLKRNHATVRRLPLEDAQTRKTVKISGLYKCFILTQDCSLSYTLIKSGCSSTIDVLTTSFICYTIFWVFFFWRDSCNLSVLVLVF